MPRIIVPMSPAARANAATLEVTAGPIRGRDGFDVNVTVRLPVRLHDGPLDRAAFANGVGEGRVVSESVERIAKLIGDDLKAAIASAAAGHTDDLLAATDAYAAAAAEAARLPLFKLGLMPDGPAAATADAPALRQRQAEQAAADAARAADDRADDLLRRFEDIRRASPDVPPGRLLMALPPEDRRDALLKLFEAAGKQEPGRLMLAAGAVVYEVEGERFRETESAGEMGPIRCLRVTHSGTALAAGAREGVVIDLLGGAAKFPAPDLGASPRGFNDVAYNAEGGRDGSIWATHRDRGLHVWSANGSACTVWDNDRLHGDLIRAFTHLGPEAACSVVPPAGSAQATAVAVSSASKRVFVAAAFAGTTMQSGSGGCGLFYTRLPSVPEGGRINFEPVAVFDDAVVVFLAERTDGGMVGAFNDGRLFSLPQLPKRQDGATLHGTFDAAVTAAAAVPWLGDVRVAACVEDGPVVVGGTDDDVRVEYRSEHKGFAAVAASGGRLAAVTGDRQRVVVWNLHEPERPILDLYALADTRSRVADVAFL